MINRFRLFTFVLCGLAAAFAQAGEPPSMKPYTGSKEFEAIKTLAGHWEGNTDEKMPNMSGQVTIDYKVTSGGSAVVETLNAGTPHEMVSVYTDNGGKLAMTHYCLMMNQPHLALK